MNPKIKTISLLSLADIISTFLGMGVPIVNILIGVPLGWFYVNKSKGDIRRRLKGLVNIALLASFITFLIMCVIWIPQLRILWVEGYDLKEFGHPLWLYDPFISFIGFIILMVIVSPVLQFLCVIGGGVLKLVRSL